jgi:GNAT superfamily N-acetyltransferase
MPPRYSVERRPFVEVETELRRLWDDNLTVDGGVERKLAWLYREAPDPPDGVFMLAADGDDEPRRWVGTAGVLIRRVQIAERELRAGLLADLAVDRAHRSVGPALMLAREARTWTLGHLDLAYGFPNRHAEGVFKRVGYKVLGKMPRYARVLRHAGYAAKVTEDDLARAPAPLRSFLLRGLQQPALANLAGLAADAAVLALGAAEGIGAASRLRLEYVARPDERFDRLWAAAHASFGVVGQRTSHFLDWRFPPSDAISFAVASTRRTGEPRAYAVLERDGDTVHVRDLFGHPTDIPALLDLVIPALYARGAASLSMRYLGAPWLVDALTARRFATRATERTITIGTSERLPAEVRARIEDATSWHMTDADEDT